jgi:hypothetical protein
MVQRPESTAVPPGAKLSSQTISQPDLSRVDPHQGAWLIAVTSLIALIYYLVAFYIPHGTIAHAWGTLLVIVSSALMLGASLLLALAAMPRWLIVLFEVLIVLDILGTGLCAYFLETPAIIAVLVVAFIGWCLLLSRDAPRVSA